MRLNDMQLRFIQECAKQDKPNASQAAINAGYSPKTAGSIGSRLLKNVEIKKLVDQARAELIQEVKDRTALSEEYVVNNLREIVERCMQRAPVTHKGKQTVDDKGNAVWAFDAKGANRALELLGKHLGMFTEKIKQENTGPNGGPIQTEIRLTLVRPPARDGSDG